MKMSKLMIALLAAGGVFLLTNQNAFAGNEISGGGQILNSGYKISFTFPEPAEDNPLGGTLQIVFHSTSVYDQVTFAGGVESLTRLPDCHQASENAAIPLVKVVKVVAQGTLNGESGYTVVFYASDSGPHGQWDASQNGADAVNILVYDTSDYNAKGSSATVLYGTAANESDDFPSEVTACPYSTSNNRTYLDHGDMFITP